MHSREEGVGLVAFPREEPFLVQGQFGRVLLAPDRDNQHYSSNLTIRNTNKDVGV
jgi:hypothetical protein